MNTDTLIPGSPFRNANRIALPIEKGLLFVSSYDIIRCEAKGNYTVVYLSDGRKCMIAKTLGEAESLLNEKPFVRVHHSHIINLDYLMSYVKGGGGYVVMTDGTMVIVSRDRKAAFLRQLDYL